MSNEKVADFLSHMTHEFALQDVSEVEECLSPNKRIPVPPESEEQVKSSTKKKTKNEGHMEEIIKLFVLPTTIGKELHPPPFVFDGTHDKNDESFNNDENEDQNKNYDEDFRMGNMEKMFKNVHLSELKLRDRRYKNMQFIQNWRLLRM